MANDTRLEVKLSAERRQQLNALAHESGISSAGLARMAIVQLIETRAVRLPAAELASP
jgi:predicted DNA-binding protein